MEWAQNANQWLDALSSQTPTPGGGAAAAVCGAMGCSLLLMAARTTLKRKNTPLDARPLLEGSIEKLERILTQLKTYAVQDARAYESYLMAAKLPKNNPARPQAVQEALWQATLVPAHTAQACKQVLAELEADKPLIDKIILSDVACARHLLNSAVACCAENVRVNTAFITQEDRVKQLQHLSRDL